MEFESIMWALKVLKSIFTSLGNTAENSAFFQWFLAKHFGFLPCTASGIWMIIYHVFEAHKVFDFVIINTIDHDYQIFTSS